MNTTGLADKKPFSESRKPVSLLLVVASLCLGMRLVTELTVYAEGPHRAYRFSQNSARNDLWNDEHELMRGVATTSWITIKT